MLETKHVTRALAFLVVDLRHEVRRLLSLPDERQERARGELEHLEIKRMLDEECAGLEQQNIILREMRAYEAKALHKATTSDS